MVSFILNDSRTATMGISEDMVKGCIDTAKAKELGKRKRESGQLDIDWLLFNCRYACYIILNYKSNQRLLSCHILPSSLFTIIPPFNGI
jgi:hypothetical protein